MQSWQYVLHCMSFNSYSVDQPTISEPEKIDTHVPRDYTEKITVLRRRSCQRGGRGVKAPPRKNYLTSRTISVTLLLIVKFVKKGINFSSASVFREQ